MSETDIVEIVRLLSMRDETLSVAESCTGGGLANAITAVPGISRVFFGSVTAYANHAKENVLHVSHETLQKYGAVSEEVAMQMAIGCRKIFSTTWAISTTGIAGPTGETVEKPLGLVYIGIAGPKKAFAKKFIFAPCTRMQHRDKTIVQAMMMFITVVRPPFCHPRA